MLGDLAINRAKRRVTVAGRPVRLTATEYELLHALSLDAGGATTYESPLRRVWGGRDGVNSQAVRSAVRKFGDNAGKPEYILTERGLGYLRRNPTSRDRPDRCSGRSEGSAALCGRAEELDRPRMGGTCGVLRVPSSFANAGSEVQFDGSIVER